DKKWKWVYTDFLSAMLTPDKTHRSKAYRQFMVETDEEIAGILEGNKWPSFLGGADFVEWVKHRFYGGSADEDEIPQTKALTLDVDWIVRTVAAFYKVDEKNICTSRRGYFNEPRNVAVYLARKLRRDKLTEIGRDFSINRYSSVSSIIRRMEEGIATDAELKNRVVRIMEQIKTDNRHKSQE
ncbi:hypothetical protein AKJ60_01245, partial [candidate division MSBL1 archaeon SCGC-AAA385M11]